MSLCRQCGHDNAHGFLFCSQCGTKLDRACPSCGAAAGLDQRFCGMCGQSLAPAGEAERPPLFGELPGEVPSHLEERIRNSRTTMDGERKQVTVLFADITGSTALIRNLDPEQAVALLDPALQHMTRAVHAQGGFVTRIQGDGIMALFGAPEAREDHAEQACRAALAIQEPPEAEGLRHIRFRVGLNSGEVVVRAVRNDLVMDYDAVGLTVHLAGRMEKLAKPGMICLTAATLRAAHDRFTTRSLGTIAVKGLAGGMEVFQLLGGRLMRSRWQSRLASGLGNFVGRARELETLGAMLRLAQAGHGQLVLVSGEAGTGKSRLIHEFARAHALDGWTVIEAAAEVEDRRASLRPVARTLRVWLGVEPDDRREDVARRLAARLAELGEDLAEHAAPLQSLLDLEVRDPGWARLESDARRRRIMGAVIAVLRRAAERQPTLMVFEDLHWLDEDSGHMLGELAALLAGLRILLVATHRSEYQPAWASRMPCTRLGLQPLDAAECQALLDERLGRAPELAALKAQLAERTQGTPLFVEEMIRTLRETGVVTGAPGDHRVARLLEGITVPPVVQTVLAERIDRLPTSRKELLQIAAVVGRAAPLRLLALVAERDAAQVAADVEALSEAELLYQVRGDDGEVVFKHGLTREVAYDSMLSERRRAIHAAVMGGLQALHAHRMDEHVETLAHHAFQGQLWAPALLYLRQAAGKAIDRSGYAEAIGHLGDALTALDRLDAPERESMEHEMGLRLTLRVALNAVGQYARRLENLDRAERIAIELQDSAKLLSVKISRGHVMVQMGQVAEAEEAGRAALELARSRADEAGHIAAAYLLGQASNFAGGFERGIEYGESALVRMQGAPTAARVGGMFGSTFVQIANQLAFSHAGLGRFEAALHHGQRGWEAANQTGRHYDISLASYGYGLAHLQRGDAAAALGVLQAGMEASEVGGVSSLFTLVGGPLSLAHAQAGALAAARALSDRVREHRETSLYMRDWSMIYRVLVLTADPQDGPALAEALTLARESVRRTREHAYPVLHAWSHFALGRALAHHDAAQAARQCARAVEQAEALGMRPLLANALRDLATLRRGKAGGEASAKAASLAREIGMGFLLRGGELPSGLADSTKTGPDAPPEQKRMQDA